MVAESCFKALSPLVRPAVLVLAFLVLLALNLSVGTHLDAVQRPSEPYGDPNASSPVTALGSGWRLPLRPWSWTG